MLACSAMLRAEEAVQKFIRIQTDDTELILQVAENGRLYQSWFGERLLHESDLRNLPWAVRAGSDGSVSTTTAILPPGSTMSHRIRSPSRAELIPR